MRERPSQAWCCCYIVVGGGVEVVAMPVLVVIAVVKGSTLDERGSPVRHSLTPPVVSTQFGNKMVIKCICL